MRKAHGNVERGHRWYYKITCRRSSCHERKQISSAAESNAQSAWERGTGAPLVPALTNYVSYDIIFTEKAVFQKAANLEQYYEKLL